MERVGQPVELLEIGVGVMFMVLRHAGDLDDDDVFDNGLAFVRTELGSEEPGADELAPPVIVAPPR